MSFNIGRLGKSTKTLKTFDKQFCLPMIISYGLLLSLPIVTVAGNASEKNRETTDASSNTSHNERLKAHWDYMGVEGPEHWGMLSKEYMACETGGRQSPIDIQMPTPGGHQETLEFHYNTSQIYELNNGHTIQVSHKSGCRVDLNMRSFQLRQFHFHEPSEHHIEGKAFPMEMHLVHQGENGQVLVIAVMMEIGADHAVLAKIWDWLPEQIGKDLSIPLNASLRDILPTNTQHFSYSGSLTTPPCTEGVRWIVLKEPIKISKQDVQRFVKIIGHNARPIQPLPKQSVEEY